MKCKVCGDRGYIESSFMRNGRDENTIIKCVHCDNTKAYSEEIKRRYGSIKETPQEKINRILGR